MTKASEIVEHMTTVFYGNDNAIDSLMRQSLAPNKPLEPPYFITFFKVK